MIINIKNNKKYSYFSIEEANKRAFLHLKSILIVVVLSISFNAIAIPSMESIDKKIDFLNQFENQYYTNISSDNYFGSKSLIINYIQELEKSGVSDLYQLQELYFHLISVSYDNSSTDEINNLLVKVKEIIPSGDHAQLAEYFYWKSGLGFAQKDYIQALEYCTIGINHAKLGNENYFLARFYHRLGYIYGKQGKVDLRKKYRLMAANVVPSDSRHASKYNGSVGIDYTLLKDFKNAEKYLNRALNCAIDGEWNWKSDSYPSIARVIHPKYYSDVLQYRAYFYRELAKTSADSIYYLKRSLMDSEETIHITNGIKSSLVFDMDLLRVNKSRSYYYYKTIEVLSRLYRATGDRVYVEKAFQYSELEKTSALLLRLQRQDAIETSGLALVDVEKANQLQLSIANLSAQIKAIGYGDNISGKELTSLYLQLYDLIEEAKAHELKMEAGNSVYKSKKSASLLQDLDFVKEISYNKAVVEYVMSDEKLYSFCFVNGQIHFTEKKFNKEFIDEVNELHQLIANAESLEFNLGELETYQTKASNLYKNLLEPFENVIGKKSLLIIPDEQLSLIPFEALVKDEVSLTVVDYTKLDYLIKHNNVSYTYSLALLKKQMEPKYKNTKNQVFAVAPTYSNLTGNEGSQYLALRDSRDGLAMLKGAKQEVQGINDKLKGRTVFENSATEELFKQEAKNYSVLHLAMHTLVDDNDPLYSKLVFTPDADENEDGLLNTYELSDLNLNADMVVLSACNTGYGKLNKGEGIVGLSRGFFLAGSNSLVATLWSVPDHTSKSIINGFYGNLEQEKDKAFSISAAKRDFIEQTNGMFGHPFFWAGYVNIGNSDAIELDSAGLDLTGYAGIFGLAILLLVMVRMNHLKFPKDFLGIF